MVTPPSTASVPSENAAPPLSWRAVALWLVFAAVLATGLVLAVRFGATAPVMLEDLFR